MALPPDYANEISTLNREILKHAPRDILQFCANFFHRRLESQRAEFLLTQRHSSHPGVAGNNFPGNNPFGAASTTPTQHLASPTGMNSVVEEDEHDLASPTTSSFSPSLHDPFGNMRASNASTATATPFNQSIFGSLSPDASEGGGGHTNARHHSINHHHHTDHHDLSRAGPSASTPQGAMEQPQSFPNNYNMNRRTSVSAESLAPASADDNHWKAPTYPKTPDQLDRIRDAVSHNFLFSHLDDEQTTQVLGALQERQVPAKGIRVIVQGDAGDYFYVVEKGNFDIYVSSTGKVEPGLDGVGKHVASSGPGTSFGELALMYNAPRAATVISAEPSVLWQLDRVTFRRILMDSAFQRRRMYESFLDKVPLLSSLTPYERSKIADALETTKYPAGSTIIREGDVGDKFFILESGTAEAVKRGREDKPLKSYQPGDYFGELALLDDKPRAASVLSTTEVKVATLEKAGFQRLLGPVESVMRRDDPRKLEENHSDPLR